MVFSASVNPWKDYIQAKCESKSPVLSLRSALLLCRVLCYPIYWEDISVAYGWPAIREDLVYLIDKASTTTTSADAAGQPDLT